MCMYVCVCTHAWLHACMYACVPPYAFLISQRGPREGHMFTLSQARSKPSSLFSTRASFLAHATSWDLPSLWNTICAWDQNHLGPSSWCPWDNHWLPREIWLIIGILGTSGKNKNKQTNNKTYLVGHLSVSEKQFCWHLPPKIYSRSHDANQVV